ncbi:MAG TPA: class I SAM-dependent methyltransferase, partial [Bacillales bacterium]|nr:class I SAM-dependent methyltransferase [Bacillales bacterium]
MDNEKLQRWMQENVAFLEDAYISEKEPWKQSGFSGPEDRWIRCRKPIADCMNRDGTFLDIGCANGYLLECVLKWKEQEGIRIEPNGLDIGRKLVEMTKERLCRSKNVHVGNALTWEPPQHYDFVRTELVYVPLESQRDFVLRLLDAFVKPGGKLIVCEYRSRRKVYDEPWINEVLIDMGFEVTEVRSGWYDGKELTRAAVIERDAMP